MKTMKIIALSLLAGALALSACTDEGSGKIKIADWATEMVMATEPDTISDKFAIVEDTADPHAFDGVIELIKQQKAAEAAAIDAGR